MNMFYSIQKIHENFTAQPQDITDAVYAIWCSQNVINAVHYLINVGQIAAVINGILDLIFAVEHVRHTTSQLNFLQFLELLRSKGNGQKAGKNDNRESHDDLMKLLTEKTTAEKCPH